LLLFARISIAVVEAYSNAVRGGQGAAQANAGLDSGSIAQNHPIVFDKHPRVP
jgi:NAD-dependent oxidoreductase involved in siderophore biosynthesis